jgi:hypothetical protein
MWRFKILPWCLALSYLPSSLHLLDLLNIFRVRKGKREREKITERKYKKTKSEGVFNCCCRSKGTVIERSVMLGV